MIFETTRRMLTRTQWPRRSYIIIKIGRYSFVPGPSFCAFFYSIICKEIYLVYNSSFKNFKSFPIFIFLI